MPPQRQPPPGTPRQASTRRILPRPSTPVTPSQQLDQIFQSDPLGPPSPESSLVAVTVASLLAHPRPTEAASDRLEEILQDFDPQDRRTVETGLTKQSSTLICIGQQAQERGQQEEKANKRRQRDAERQVDDIAWLEREWPRYLPPEIRIGNSSTLGVEKIGVKSAQDLRSIAEILKRQGINPDLLWERGGLLQVAVAEDFAKRSRNRKEGRATLKQRLTHQTVKKVLEAIRDDPESARRTDDQPGHDDNDNNDDSNDTNDRNHDIAFGDLETTFSDLPDLPLDDTMDQHSSKKRIRSVVDKTFRPGATPIEEQIQDLSHPELVALQGKLSSELKNTRDEKLAAETRCARLQGLNNAHHKILDYMAGVEQEIAGLSAEDDISHDDSAIGLGGRAQNAIMRQEMAFLASIRKEHLSRLQNAVGLSSTAGEDHAAQLARAQQDRDAAGKAEAEAESRMEVVKDMETLWLRHKDWRKATEDHDAAKQGREAMLKLQGAAKSRVQEAEAAKENLNRMLQEADASLELAKADLEHHNRALHVGDAKYQESGQDSEKACQDLAACVEKLDQQKAMALLRSSLA